MVKPSRIRPFLALDDALGISNERGQLLFHTEQNGECTDDDEQSIRCQVCGRDDVNPTSKQKCAGTSGCSSAQSTLTGGTASTVKSTRSALETSKMT